MHLHNCFQTIHSALLKTFYRGISGWKVNGRLQFQKYPTHQFTKKSQRELSCFLTWNFEIRQNIIIWNLVCTLILQILLKPWLQSLKKDAITEKAVSHSKCLEDHKNLTFTLQKNLVSHSVVWTSHTFSEVLLAIKLERCWKEKDFRNQNLLRILSAYTLSWFTQTWLSTISLARRRPQCCVGIILFQV